MSNRKNRLTIGWKMFILVLATVLFAGASVCAFSYFVSVKQIDGYFKKFASNSADNYAYIADGDFLSELKAVVESGEFQQLRARAEETDDESLIRDYLIERNLWIQYDEERTRMINYVRNMDEITYLYIICWNQEEPYDMYLMDADDVPLYETGYHEPREERFEDFNPLGQNEPTISESKWGNLCSAYAPIYDRYGNFVCLVGCDIEMSDIMQERLTNLGYSIIGAVICTMFVLIVAFIIVNRIVVRPLNEITEAMKDFSPSAHSDIASANVIDLNIRSNDEIRDIHDEIRSMQLRILNYISSITDITKQKELAETEVGKMSRTAYRDDLTGIGNKTAYTLKVKDLDLMIQRGNAEFAIVMVDVNGLKEVNDEFGHASGDIYLNGCCRIMCNIFKHSPIYRIGGDEFVAVLTGEDYENRSERTEELRTEYKKASENFDNDPWLRFSAAVGIAEYASEDRTVEIVFNRADKYMYDDKTKCKRRKNNP